MLNTVSKLSILVCCKQWNDIFAAGKLAVLALPARCNDFLQQVFALCRASYAISLKHSRICLLLHALALLCMLCTMSCKHSLCGFSFAALCLQCARTSILCNVSLLELSSCHLIEAFTSRRAAAECVSELFCISLLDVTMLEHLSTCLASD